MMSRRRSWTGVVERLTREWNLVETWEAQRGGTNAFEEQLAIRAGSATRLHRSRLVALQRVQQVWYYL